jgi:uncharacterized protein with PQ loop repeat
VRYGPLGIVLAYGWALAACVQALAILLLSLRRGIGGSDRLDYICLTVCLLGMTFWLISGQSMVGLMAAIVADLVACLPSLIKTIRQPHTESVLFFGLGAIAGVLVLLAGPYTWQAALFPAYIFLIDALYVAIIIRAKVVRQ